MSYTYAQRALESLEAIENAEELKIFKTALTEVLNHDPKLDGLTKITAIIAILHNLGLTEEQLRNNYYSLTWLASKNELDVTNHNIDLICDQINNNRYVQLTNQMRERINNQ